ncbi:MAG TPA: response regulator [Thermoanaerobaculia bacterium]|nr:response regulator [Thermoanaerobaculia bacterium]
MVLVVDDDPATLVLLRKVLAQAGFAVDVAGGGAEAMTLALTRKYDAVLLDLVMPPPDGFAVLRQIAAVAPRLLPKVIVITSYPQRVHAANTYALLNKPLDLREVVRLTRECTEKQA